MELETQIETLRSRIAEHQTVVTRLETQADRLRVAPKIPSNTTPQQVAAIFETHSGFDDQIAGLEAAIAELNRRLKLLRSQFQGHTQALQQFQEQERRNKLTRSVLAEIKG